GRARDGRVDQGSQGRRRRARGHSVAAALSRCEAGIGDVTMRNSECGMRNGDTTFARQFRIPHFTFRILLICAAGACGAADGPRVTVTIPAGASLEAAVDSLTASRVIDHPGLFRVYARVRGLAGSLKSGVYLLQQDESWSDVVAALERGRGVEQRFTVREGLRLAEVAELARAQLKIPR